MIHCGEAEERITVALYGSNNNAMNEESNILGTCYADETALVIGADSVPLLHEKV